MGMSAAHCQGNVREFQSVWRVVTLIYCRISIVMYTVDLSTLMCELGLAGCRCVQFTFNMFTLIPVVFSAFLLPCFFLCSRL